MHEYLLLRKTERIEQLALEQKRQGRANQQDVEKMARKEADRDKVIQALCATTGEATQLAGCLLCDSFARSQLSTGRWRLSAGRRPPS